MLNVPNQIGNVYSIISVFTNDCLKHVTQKTKSKQNNFFIPKNIFLYYVTNSMIR